MRGRRQGIEERTIMSRSPLLFACIALFLAASLDAKQPARQRSKKAGGQKGGEFVCSKECIVHECGSIGLRYGKYCGVGHGGCPGEEPCDAIDACCKDHDDCVTGKGMLANQCHQALKVCLRDQMKAGVKGFTDECKPAQVAQVISQGMDLAMMFGGMAGGMNM